jgi:hypothetical protein
MVAVIHHCRWLLTSPKLVADSDVPVETSSLATVNENRVQHGCFLNFGRGRQCGPNNAFSKAFGAVDVEAAHDVPFCDQSIGISTAGEDGNHV